MGRKNAKRAAKSLVKLGIKKMVGPTLAPTSAAKENASSSPAPFFYPRFFHTRLLVSGVSLENGMMLYPEVLIVLSKKTPTPVFVLGLAEGGRAGSHWGKWHKITGGSHLRLFLNHHSNHPVPDIGMYRSWAAVRTGGIK